MAEDATAKPSSMVTVSAGTFWMGCRPESDSTCEEDEKPGGEVFLGGFGIDRTEVTVAQYAVCVDSWVCKEPDSDGEDDNWGKSGRESHPVNSVSWTDAKAYCGWAGKRLPTEAEWEKAARGTDGRTYPWGNGPATCSRAVMRDAGRPGCGKDSTWPVGSKPSGASPYGALDMAGNVWEWTADWYDAAYYAERPAKNPRGPSIGSDRVRRGGSIGSDRVRRGGSFVNSASGMRAPYRYAYPPAARSHVIGFRCARSLP